MDPQQFDQTPPSPSQQKQTDLHEDSQNHGDDDADSIEEKSIEQTNTGLDKHLDVNTEGNKLNIHKNLLNISPKSHAMWEVVVVVAAVAAA